MSEPKKFQIIKATNYAQEIEQVIYEEPDQNLVIFTIELSAFKELESKLEAHKEIIAELMEVLDSISSVHLTEETLGALSVETQQDTLLARESLTISREKLENLK